MQFVNTKLITLLAASALTACGGGSGSDTSTTAKVGTETTGTFVDAPVQGIAVYVGGKKIATTDAKGQFKYKVGDTVTFKLGEVTLGSKKDPQTVTPADLTPYTNSLNNMLILLQSLDSDSNPDNGITIPSAVIANMKTKVNLADKNTTLTAIQNDLKTQVTKWVDVKKAQDHFQNALTSIEPNDLVKKVANDMVGISQSNCQDGTVWAIEIKKKEGSANTIYPSKSYGYKYANSNCTGSYTTTQNTDLDKWHKIQGVVKDGDKYIVTVQTKRQDNRVDIEQLTYKKGMFKVNDEVYKKTNSFMPVVKPSVTNLSDAQLIEKGIDNIVGYWKSTCQASSNGSKHYYFEVQKVNKNSFKFAQKLVQRFSSSNCSGSSKTVDTHYNEVITLKNPTNNGKTFSLSSGNQGKITFISSDNFTVEGIDDGQYFKEENNRISENDFPKTPILSNAQLQEKGVDKLVGYWKSACLAIAGKSNAKAEVVFTQLVKVNNTTVKPAKNFIREYSSSDCSGKPISGKAEIPSETYELKSPSVVDGKLTFLPTNSDGARLTIESDNKFVVGNEANYRITGDEEYSFPIILHGYYDLGCSMGIHKYVELNYVNKSVSNRTLIVQTFTDKECKGTPSSISSSKDTIDLTTTGNASINRLPNFLFEIMLNDKLEIYQPIEKAKFPKT